MITSEPGPELGVDRGTWTITRASTWKPRPWGSRPNLLLREPPSAFLHRRRSCRSPWCFSAASRPAGHGFTAAEHGPGFVVFRALRSLDSRLPHGGAPTARKHSKQVAALTVGM